MLRRSSSPGSRPASPSQPVAARSGEQASSTSTPAVQGESKGTIETTPVAARATAATMPRGLIRQFARTHLAQLDTLLPTGRTAPAPPGYGSESPSPQSPDSPASLLGAPRLVRTEAPAPKVPARTLDRRALAAQFEHAVRCALSTLVREGKINPAVLTGQGAQRAAAAVTLAAPAARSVAFTPKMFEDLATRRNALLAQSLPPADHPAHTMLLTLTQRQFEELYLGVPVMVALMELERALNVPGDQVGPIDPSLALRKAMVSALVPCLDQQAALAQMERLVTPATYGSTSYLLRMQQLQLLRELLPAAVQAPLLVRLEAAMGTTQAGVPFGDAVSRRLFLRAMYDMSEPVSVRGELDRLCDARTLSGAPASSSGLASRIERLSALLRCLPSARTPVFRSMLTQPWGNDAHGHESALRQAVLEQLVLIAKPAVRKYYWDFIARPLATPFDLQRPAPEWRLRLRVCAALASGMDASERAAVVYDLMSEDPPLDPSQSVQAGRARGVVLQALLNEQELRSVWHSTLDASTIDESTPMLRQQVRIGNLTVFAQCFTEQTCRELFAACLAVPADADAAAALEWRHMRRPAVTVLLDRLPNDTIAALIIDLHTPAEGGLAAARLQMRDVALDSCYRTQRVRGALDWRAQQRLLLDASTLPAGARRADALALRRVAIGALFKYVPEDELRREWSSLSAGIVGPGDDDAAALRHIAWQTANALRATAFAVPSLIDKGAGRAAH